MKGQYSLEHVEISKEKIFQNFRRGKEKNPNPKQEKMGE